MSYSMPAVSTPKNRTDFKNSKGNHECVEFVRGITNAPETIAWKKGRNVLDAEPGSIPYGTAIATFDEKGHYSKGGPGQQHAAIYISHIKGKSIDVFEQYNSLGKVVKRTIHDLSTDKKSNNPKAYSVIE
jgi:hypothetical protein